jgi:hypothetical protein
VDAMVNGCTPSSCRGGYDKDLSGIMIDGFVFRFAACQFGQKTAGSPLGSNRSAQSCGRWLDCAGSGSVLCAATQPCARRLVVDDLIFIMSTPEHGERAGFVGGCPVCTEYHGRALKVQELPWPVT